MASSDKSRSSSSRPSFFSRNKNKHDRPNYDDGRHLSSFDYHDSGASSSRTSHHHRNSSAVSIDRADTPDSGLNMTAGVITSIPYDSIRHDSRSPSTPTTTTLNLARAAASPCPITLTRASEITTNTLPLILPPCRTRPPPPFGGAPTSPSRREPRHGLARDKLPAASGPASAMVRPRLRADEPWQQHDQHPIRLLRHDNGEDVGRQC
ncbi:unnamed protein product [Parascedosporium putredinis]|uniref:Uncharacterized protein n=1 Tax=Parascedosporium putredinis TaxID=1442378 RepID=A0A9P1H0L9_9PEZI|nr:unnamed protein product [Parascedosporium putredinis]CAI7992947.1 unnamed protein product [Parascedosporium putredinis]